MSREFKENLYALTMERTSRKQKWKRKYGATKDGK
jgi:hypothetical protein